MRYADKYGRPIRKTITITAALSLLSATVLSAHDLFFRTGSFFVTPGAVVQLQALNGTFSKSENSITHDRISDLSVVSPAGHAHPEMSSWSSTGDTSVLTFRAAAAGTYVAGASLLPREITLDAKDFNAYLTEDGIPDVLAERRRKGELGKPATERYSKHIKALVQVGSSPSGDYAAVLGYPAEIVPLDNPYSLRAGQALRVRTLVDGKAVGNQLVVSGGRNARGGRITESRVRSDKDGVARIRLVSPGQWYVKFISMQPFQGTEKIDYESKWATLTFEVR